MTDQVALVLLAAGDSKRFQGNKLLTPLNGKWMYRYVVEEIKKLPEDVFCSRVVVSQYPEILKQLGAEGYETVENKESCLGISHSIHLALERLEQQSPCVKAVCFAVCDQPWLRGETILAMVEGWRKSGKGMACLQAGNQLGNPALFSGQFVQKLKDLQGDMGGRRVLAAFPDEVYYHSVEDKRELEDVDTRLCH